MKKTTRLIAIAMVSLFGIVSISAQCEPDTANCKDVDLPGEFCPKNLDPAEVDVPYDKVITVIPPGEFDYPGVGTVTIHHILIDSVTNLPEGIDYFPNATEFYPDTAYCIQITGTATTSGEFQLGIYVSVYIDLVGNPTLAGQIVDDTSVVMTVTGTSGFDPYQVREFKVLPNVPNPFSEYTRLGFFTPFDDRIELKVYNILGELMHEEKQGAPPGEHYFQFDGSALLPGTYFYKVANGSGFFTGKFIKSK
jgi:hypothetical protein